MHLPKATNTGNRYHAFLADRRPNKRTLWFTSNLHFQIVSILVSRCRQQGAKIGAISLVSSLYPSATQIVCYASPRIPNLSFLIFDSTFNLGIYILDPCTPRNTSESSAMSLTRKLNSSSSLTTRTQISGELS